MVTPLLHVALSAELFAPLPNLSIAVLLVDDQPIIAEAVRRHLSDLPDISFSACSDPANALERARQMRPTVILLDLVMPGIDGLTLLKAYKGDQALADIPIVVLSVEEEPLVKAEAFALGASDYIVKLPDKLELAARIRTHSLAYIRLKERNAAMKRLQESQQVLKNELKEAAAYVASLLPPPITHPFAVDWRFIPSMELGGDAFGYHWLDDRFFALYLLDVCGHGVGAALHSVSIINALRSQSLPNTDFHSPRAVLKELNAVYRMEDHHDLFFTIWYGVYDKEKDEWVFANGGHPPALLIRKGGEMQELTAEGVAVGVLPEALFQEKRCQVESGDTLFLLSDGLFEIPKEENAMMTMGEFKPNFIEGKEKRAAPLDTVIKRARALQHKEDFADDVSILQVLF